MNDQRKLFEDCLSEIVLLESAAKKAIYNPAASASHR